MYKMGTPACVPIFIQLDKRMIESTLPRVSAVILAGGKSRRMGRDKAFLEIDGELLVERVIARVRRVCEEVVLVSNNRDSYARFGVRVVGDVYPNKGSLGGIYSGLQTIQGTHALAVTCDMPFLNEALLRHLISLAPQADVIVPRARDLSSNLKRGAAQRPDKPMAKEKDLHPTHAIYSKSCIEPMRARLLADDLRIIGFYEVVKVLIVEPAEIDQFDPKHLSFFNANTPEDLIVASSLSRMVE
jgi:molybdopterin-guanine dinucleotide biosynthesis protein A